jgi:hypothetical protein
MPPTHRNYDPNLVYVSFKGVILTGWLDGTFVQIQRDEDAYSLEAGVGGDTAFVKNHRRTGVITITLMQTAPSNDTLAGFVNDDEIFSSGEGEIFVKDGNGNTLAEDPSARIAKMADVSYAKGIEGREWRFLCPRLFLNTGSSTS